MIRLKSIHITGFKDPEEKKDLVFSTESITVIYGENGSGKTTFLKVLFAVLSRDEGTLYRENVMEVVIEYFNNGKEKKLIIKRNENDEFLWGTAKDLYESSSILFGIYRGINQRSNIRIEEELIIKNIIDIIEKNKTLLTEQQEIFGYLARKAVNSTEVKRVEDSLNKNLSEIIKNEYTLYREITDLDSSKQINFIGNLEKKHLFLNYVEIDDIKQSIISQYIKGQNIVSEKIKTAFFETIEKTIEIDEHKANFPLPNDFNKKIEANKSFILKALPNGNSTLAKRVKKYIETQDEKLTNSKIFRALLLEMIQSAEEPNPELEAITKLIEIFNEHLYKNKKLIVTQEEVYINLSNDKRHELSELSSGERNLLSILTMFLVVGLNRNFLIIDEPEISINLDWQRKLLPLLSNLNPNVQIIVASHSPSIANQNTNFLSELV